MDFTPPQKSHFFIYISQISQLILRCTEDKRQYDTKQKLTMGSHIMYCEQFQQPLSHKAAAQQEKRRL